MHDVIVLGDTAWDTVVRIKDPMMFNQDVAAEIHSGPGGQGLNMAATACRQGAKTALVTQVGTDSRSRFLLRWLRREGVHLPMLTSANPLTRVVSVVRSDGERALLTDSGSGPLAWPKPRMYGRVLVVSGYLVDRPQGDQRLLAWMTWARQRHMTILLDPSHPRLASQLKPFVRHTDWLLSNEEEWEALGAPRDVSLLLKQGARGIQVLSGTKTLHIPSPPGPIIDTTGAGDAVAGAFAAFLAKSLDPADAAKQAAQCGVRACGRIGAI